MGRDLERFGATSRTETLARPTVVVMLDHFKDDLERNIVPSWCTQVSSETDMRNGKKIAQNAVVDAALTYYVPTIVRQRVVLLRLDPR
jgi:hypothetical protein